MNDTAGNKLTRWLGYLLSQMMLLALYWCAREFRGDVHHQRTGDALADILLLQVCVAAWAFGMYVSVHRPQNTQSK